MAPKISVVVPVYNGGEIFLRTLESICAQTEGDFELIVVNDGSTDNTEKALAGFAAKDPRVRPFSIPNGGSSRARNYGLGQAKGQYLYFCDADDIPEPEILARLSAELIKAPSWLPAAISRKRKRKAATPAARFTPRLIFAAIPVGRFCKSCRS